MIVRLLVSVLLLALTSGFQLQSPTRTPFHGRLFAAVSGFGQPDIDVGRDGALVPADVRARFTTFAQCVTNFRSRLRDTDDFYAGAALPHRRALERALACTGTTPNRFRAAAEYAANARILYEWEGDYHSPLEEAADAEAFVREHPTSPLVPYLNLFVATLNRFAFELLDKPLSDAEMIELASEYQRFLNRARVADPLVRLLADDLDALPFVYDDQRKHPRDVRR